MVDERLDRDLGEKLNAGSDENSGERQNVKLGKGFGEVVLKAEDIDAGYKDKKVVFDISFDIKKGEFISMIGPNGSGKSTLLKTVSGGIPALKGNVYLKGKNIRDISDKDFVRQLSIMLTNQIKPEYMSLWEYVAFGRYPYTGRFGVLSAKDKEVVNRSIEMVGVKELSHRQVNELSDGQRQLSGLARAICQEPDILLLDEPTSFLDIRYKLEFLSCIKSLCENTGLTVFMSLHEVHLAGDFSDRILCIKNGKKDKMDIPSNVLTDKYIRELYGIRDDLKIYQGFTVTDL